VYVCLTCCALWTFPPNAQWCDALQEANQENQGPEPFPLLMRRAQLLLQLGQDVRLSPCSSMTLPVETCS